MVIVNKTYSRFFPGKSYRAITYAPMENMISEIIVAIDAIIRELSAYCIMS